MNAFFWSRRKPSHELVRSVDALLAQLVPDDKLGHAFDALAISCVDERALEMSRKRGGSGASSMAATDDSDVSSLKPQRCDDEQRLSFEVLKCTRTDSGDACDLFDDSSNSLALDPDGLPQRLQEDDNSDEHNSDDEPCAKTVPEELEQQWGKIRSVFHRWDDDECDRVKKMDRMADLLLRYRVLEKALFPKVFALLTFETRKYVGHVFRAMTVHNLRGFNELVASRTEILRWLVDGYRNNDTALICGAMLRDCFEHATLVVTFLHVLENEFATLIKVTLSNNNFDISADAFMNITRLLMAHKAATAATLEQSFDRIFGHLNSLLTSENYVTKRQACQLLAELLLDPVNFAVMQRYVASRANLKRVMLLLREPSHALRMDAFHVFKIFVANPNKSSEVTHVLVRNRDKLLAFVSDFGKQELSREFHNERSLLVFTLLRLDEQDATLRVAAAAAAAVSAAATAKVSNVPIDAAVKGVAITNATSEQTSRQ